jgi:hypothetical protein
MQAGMKRALVNAGHEVTVAGDGREGLIAARETLPDLILLDMMLPMMSGNRGSLGTEDGSIYEGDPNLCPHRPLAKERGQAAACGGGEVPLMD